MCIMYVEISVFDIYLGIARITYREYYMHQKKIISYI